MWNRRTIRPLLAPTSFARFVCVLLLCHILAVLFVPKKNQIPSAVYKKNLLNCNDARLSLSSQPGIHTLVHVVYHMGFSTTCCSVGKRACEKRLSFLHPIARAVYSYKFRIGR